MKRWLVRISVFLLLGAIVNVAVAWAAIGRIRSDARWIFGTYLTISYTCSGDPRATQTDFECGFPAASVRGTTPPAQLNAPAWQVTWIGSFINTVVFAGAFWLVYSLPSLWRALLGVERIRRGLCPKCAYDLRGRESDSTACPECGHRPG